MNITIDNTKNVEQLKEAYLEAANLADFKTEQVRLFYSGKEILNSYYLYQYNV